MHNDASGTWYVQIGVKHPEQSASALGMAMFRAFAVNEYDPEWQWTTDYLRSLNTSNSDP